MTTDIITHGWPPLACWSITFTVLYLHVLSHSVAKHILLHRCRVRGKWRTRCYFVAAGLSSFARMRFCTSRGQHAHVDTTLGLTNMKTLAQPGGFRTPQIVSTYGWHAKAAQAVELLNCGNCNLLSWHAADETSKKMPIYLCSLSWFEPNIWH